MVKLYTGQDLKMDSNNPSLDKYARKLVGAFVEHYDGQACRKLLSDGTTIDIRQAGPNNINCRVNTPRPKKKEEREEEILIRKFRQPGLCIALVSERDALIANRENKYLIYNPDQDRFVEQHMVWPPGTDKAIIHDATYSNTINYITYSESDNHYVINAFANPGVDAISRLNVGLDKTYVAYTKLFESSALVGLAGQLSSAWIYKPSNSGKNLTGFFIAQDGTRLKVYKYSISAYPISPQSVEDVFETITDPLDIEEIANLRLHADMTSAVPGTEIRIDFRNVTMLRTWPSLDGSSLYLSTYIERHELDRYGSSDTYGFFFTPEMFRVDILYDENLATYSAEIVYLDYDHPTDYLGRYQSFYNSESTRTYSESTIGGNGCIDCGGSDWRETGTSVSNLSDVTITSGNNSGGVRSSTFVHGFTADEDRLPVQMKTTTTSTATSDSFNKDRYITGSETTYNGCSAETTTYDPIQDTYEETANYLASASTSYTFGKYNLTGHVSKSLGGGSYSAKAPIFADLINDVVIYEEETVSASNTASVSGGMKVDGVEVFTLPAAINSVDVHGRYRFAEHTVSYGNIVNSGNISNLPPITYDSNSCGIDPIEAWHHNDGRSATLIATGIGAQDNDHIQWFYQRTTWGIDMWTRGSSMAMTQTLTEPWIHHEYYPFYPEQIQYNGFEGDYVAVITHGLTSDGQGDRDLDTIVFNKKDLGQLGSTLYNVPAMDEIAFTFVI